jgi:nucleoside-diphosphate-sugar epimerase
MQVIDPSKPVMVTGASGYLASWIVKKLLDKGMSVVATVRDPMDLTKTGHLQKLANGSAGTLKLFKADLLEAGSFDEPMSGCELVIHTASPFMLTMPKNAENELIEPARTGTRNVLEAAKRSGTVKRVVLTSSVVAIYGDLADIASAQGGVFTETDWNTTSSAEHQPYAYSKTLAEKEAWTISKEQDRWDLVTINPGWIIGPSLTRRTDSASIKTMIEFGNGTYKKGVPQMWLGTVDVRDVAEAHLRAGFTPEASGRHIVVNQEIALIEIARILRENFGNDYPFPRKEAPKFLFWLIAPMFGRTRKSVKKNVGIRIRFDNSRSRKELGLSYLPIEQTITEHFQQIVDDGLLARS